VTATDKATNREQNITITSSSGLSESEVEELVQEAASNEADDQIRRDIIESRNQLDNLLYQTEKVLSDNKEKLPEDEVANVETAVANAKEALDSDELDTLKGAFEALTAASHKLAEVAYQDADGDAAAGGPAPEGDGGDGGDGGDDDVIDAEFEEA
jgi:molecular chaperone DnaK